MPEDAQEPKKKRTRDDRIDLIASAIAAVKAKRIRRIVKQLARMSPNDVATLERLIGKR
jgi:hypothetical protein